MSERCEVYVGLRDEGTAVWRPVVAEKVGPGSFRLSGPMPEGESWEFAPGAVVRCQDRELLSGSRVLVAVALSNETRPPGCLQIVLFGATALLMSACLLPRPICCLYYGRDRVDPNAMWVDIGTTAEEVAARFGQPHEKIQRADGKEEWHYHTDIWGSGATYIGLEFDQQGRVTWHWNE
jgi:hypothetical protein